MSARLMKSSSPPWPSVAPPLSMRDRTREARVISSLSIANVLRSTIHPITGFGQAPALALPASLPLSLRCRGPVPSTNPGSRPETKHRAGPAPRESNCWRVPIGNRRLDLQRLFRRSNIEIRHALDHEHRVARRDALQTGRNSANGLGIVNDQHTGIGQLMGLNEPGLPPPHAGPNMRIYPPRRARRGEVEHGHVHSRGGAS